MAYHTLAEDVYLVRGAARACIYDLARGNLYSITSDFADFLESLEKAETSIHPHQEQYLSLLREESLLREVSAPQSLIPIQSLKKAYPVDFAWVEVTRQCNLTCTFCYEGSNPHCVERMSVGEFKQVTHNLVEAGIKAIQFIGGEPTILKDDLKDMIRHARKHFDFIEVYTNGVTINDAWCQFFIEYKVNVALSIHSYIAEEHDKVTQVKGSHKRAVRALELLKKYNIPHRTGTVRSKSCKVGEPNDKAPYKLEPVTPKATGMADIQQFDRSMFHDHAIQKASKRRPLTKESVVRALSGHQCFVREIYVSSLLDVFPCVMERRLKHGNLKESRLVDILDDGIRFLTKDNIEGCRTCEYRYGCFDCRPDSNGKGVYQKPWYCSYDPTSGTWHELDAMFSRLQKKASLNSIPVVMEN